MRDSYDGYMAKAMADDDEDGGCRLRATMWRTTDCNDASLCRDLCVSSPPPVPTIRGGGTHLYEHIGQVLTCQYA